MADDENDLDKDGKDPAREQDCYLPIANITRLMKEALPPEAKVGREAKHCMQESVSEFISFITSEASDKCSSEKRKTINGDDILWAMQSLGFDEYLEPLKTFLQRYRNSERASNRRVGPPGSGGSSSSSSGVGHKYDHHEQQQHLAYAYQDGGLIPSTMPPFVFGFLVLCALLCADAQAQKPVCCTPDQWRGEVTSSLFVRTNSSKREFLSDVFHEFIEYDAINRRLRIDFVERDQTTGQQENFTQIFLYQTGTYYFLHGPGTELSRTCVVSSLRPPFNQFEPACVDSEYQSKSQLTMGSPNGEHLTVDSFEYAQHSETAQISSGCWPVTGTFLSHQRQQRRFGRVEAKYYNLRAGVNEESFAVPPACSSESVPSSHTASASKSQKACGCGCHIQSVMYCCPKSAYKECSPTDTGVDCLCNNGTPCIHSCTSS